MDNKQPNDPARLRVLVVDDNQDSADVCGLLIRKSGHEVRTAYSGADALQAANEFRPEFILLDIGLPDIDGYEIARRIRSTEWGRGATLVAVTGWVQDEDVQEARAAGFDHHLQKPVDLALLRSLLVAKQA